MELLALGLAVLGLASLLWGLWPRRSGARAGQSHTGQRQTAQPAPAQMHPRSERRPVSAGTYVAPTFDPLASPALTNDLLNAADPLFDDPTLIDAAPVDVGTDADSAEADSENDSRLSDAGCLPDPADSAATDWGGTTETASCDSESSSDSASSDSGSTSSE